MSSSRHNITHTVNGGEEGGGDYVPKLQISLRLEFGRAPYLYILKEKLRTTETH